MHVKQNAEQGEGQTEDKKEIAKNKRKSVQPMARDQPLEPNEWERTKVDAI
jgi:hypothetical protein